MKKLFTFLALMLMYSVTASAAFVDVKVDFTNNQILTESETSIISVGIKMNDDGTATRVAADDASANAVVTGKWHSPEHGLANFSATVKVDGPVKIGMGSCKWGGNVTIKDESGNEVANAFNTNDGTCWHNEKHVIYTYYKGEAATLTIAGGSYTPYFSVEAVTLEDIPHVMKVYYSLGESGATGILPANFELDGGKTFTTPVNRTLYVEGKTLTGWTDGTNTYTIGQEITAVADTEMTLVPVFTNNTVTLGDRTEAVTLTWDFQQKNGAPVVSVQGKTMIWVAQAVVNGQTIDVKMDIDATSGKVANGSWTDWAQINGGTKLTIPAAKGAVIGLESYSATTTTTIAGEVINQGTKTPSYTYNGNASTVDIVIGDGSYWRTVSVSLPVPSAPSYTLTTADTDFYGLYLPYQAAVPEGVTAYTGALSNDQTTLTLTAISGDIPANTAVLVKSNAAGEYTFNVSDAEAATVGNNSLEGVTVETAVADLAEDGKTVLTLGISDGVVAFRKPAAETIKANKVYLLVDAASTAKIRIVEGEATGIEENYEFGINNSDEATYDLSGRKVANPTKGLYIKNGKKFIVK